MDRKLKLSLILLLVIATIAFIVVMVNKVRRFAPIKDEGQAQQLVQRFPWVVETQMTDLQKQRLVETLGEILVIYKDGDFEKFLNYLRKRKGSLDKVKMAQLREVPVFYIFKISPHQLSIKEQREYQRIKQIVEKVAPKFAEWPPKSDIDVFKAHWLLTYHEAGPWNGVDIKTAYVRVFQTSQPIDPNSALKAIRNRSPMALVTFRSTVFPGEEKRPCLYVEAYFVARHPTPDPYWGYYLWLRWSEQIQNWFLDLAGMTFSGERGENTDLLF